MSQGSKMEVNKYHDKEEHEEQSKKTYNVKTKLAIPCLLSHKLFSTFFIASFAL